MSLAILGSLDMASKSQALALWAMSWTIHHNWLRSFGQAPNLRRGMMWGGAYSRKALLSQDQDCNSLTTIGQGVSSPCPL